MSKVSEELKHYIESHSELIQVKPSTLYPNFSVIKYKNKCFYKNIWNKYIEQCRGLVVDNDWNIINYPLTKIFNYGIESKAPRISGEEYVTAVRKINGFMAAVSVHNNELIVSTTGTLDSDYAKLAKQEIERCISINDLELNNTYIFEICHSSDPHIIPEIEGVYFLGKRENILYSKICSSYLDGINDTLRVIYPEVRVDKFNNIKQHVKTVKHEGYVIYTIDGRSTKIKSPYYLFNKFLARTKDTAKILDKHAKRNLPEEFYPVIDQVQKDIDNFISLKEQDRLNYIKNIFENL